MSDDSAQTMSRPAVKAIRPLRVVFRLTALVALTAFYYTITIMTIALAPVSGALVRRVRRRLARQWAYGIGAITGMRIEVHGQPPKEPYFAVSNHVTWLDGFVMARLLHCTYVGMAEIQTMPFVRTIIRGIEPIFVYRRKDDTPRVVDLMVKELERGGSLYMCPEAIVSPGREIRRFRGALLEAAVRTRTPVHYATITYRTAEDSPPPSHCILFGPDPYYRTPDGKIPESELAVWGPERSMKRYLLRLLSVSSYTAVVTFGSESISGTDKHALANALCDAVRAQFTPVK